MSVPESSAGPEPRSRPMQLLGMVALWLAGLAAFITGAGGEVVRGLLFVLLGVLALALAGHGGGAPRVVRCSPARFWREAAHQAWLAGGLGGVLLFARALGTWSATIRDIVSRMALAVAPIAWGLILAMVFAVAALRAPERAAREEPGSGGAAAWERAVGVLLLLGLVATSVGRVPWAAAAGGLDPWRLLAHWPAVLLVAGVALAASGVAGTGPDARTAMPACALAGALAGLVGLLVALTGFAQQDLARVTSGVSFMITSCSTALVGLLAAASLGGSADVERPRESASVVQSAWALFPLVAVLFLVIVFLLVVTPMTRRL